MTMQMEQVDPRASEFLDEAVQAVRAMLATRHEGRYEGRYAVGLGPDYRPARAASDAVRRALRWDWTPAQIAHLAGVRQLLVARLIEDDGQRAAALVAARHDAERYAAEVRTAIRSEALIRYAVTADERGAKSRITTDLKISRPTLDEWLAGDVDWSPPECDDEHARIE